MSEPRPAGVHEAMQLAEMVARGPFWTELHETRAALESALRERDEARAALRAIAYRAHHGPRTTQTLDMELVAAKALAGDSFPEDGIFQWSALGDSQ